MEVFWHHLRFPCPQCQADTPIVKVMAAADGDIRLFGTCANCSIWVRIDTSLMKWLALCVQQDFLHNQAAQAVSEHNAKPGAPVVPPLNQGLLLTNEDHKFLYGMGIDDQDGNKAA